MTPQLAQNVSEAENRENPKVFGVRPHGFSQIVNQVCSNWKTKIAEIKLEYILISAAQPPVRITDGRCGL